MRKDWDGAQETVLRVDGGMTASDWTMQFLADILACPVDRPQLLETTALGSAYLAGLQSGIYPQSDDFAKSLTISPSRGSSTGDSNRRCRKRSVSSSTEGGGMRSNAH